MKSIQKDGIRHLVPVVTQINILIQVVIRVSCLKIVTISNNDKSWMVGFELLGTTSQMGGGFSNELIGVGVSPLCDCELLVHVLTSRPHLTASRFYEGCSKDVEGSIQSTLHSSPQPGRGVAWRGVAWRGVAWPDTVPLEHDVALSAPQTYAWPGTSRGLARDTIGLPPRRAAPRSAAH